MGANTRVSAAQKTRRDIRPPAGPGAHDDGAGGWVDAGRLRLDRGRAGRKVAHNYYNICN